MENPRDTKQKQMKALVEKMKLESKPIDWAAIVLCRAGASCCKRQDAFLSYPHSMVLQKVYFIGEAKLH